MSDMVAVYILLLIALGTAELPQWPFTGAAADGGCQILAMGQGSEALHSCAVMTDGSLKCWGNNENSQCGRPVEEEYYKIGNSPAEMGAWLDPVALGKGRTVKQVALGGEHTCVLLDSGEISCFGYNLYGQLGFATSTYEYGSNSSEMGDALPRINLGTGRTASQVAAGAAHTCALLDDASLKCWGDNSYGQLGLGDIYNRGGGGDDMGDNLGTVDLGTNRTAGQVVAGHSHTCALLDNGDVRCWGKNDHGQLGIGRTIASRGTDSDEMGDLLPRVNLGTGRTARQLVAGKNHNCAVLDDASLRCWGGSAYGQLGAAMSSDIGISPNHMGDNLKPVDLGTGRSVREVAAGALHTCALLDDYTFKCWGLNEDGQLGIGTNIFVMGSPQPVIFFLGGGEYLHQVTAGASHTCAILEPEGALKCWGSGEYGQLGLGSDADVGSTPEDMDNLPSVQLCAPQPPQLRPPGPPTAAPLAPNSSLPPAHAPPGAQTPSAASAALPSATDESASGGLARGAIAGVVASTAAVAALGLLAGYLWVRRRAARTAAAAQECALTKAVDSGGGSSAGSHHLHIRDPETATSSLLSPAPTPASHMAISGLPEWDAFVRESACHYSWTTCDSSGLTPVEAGVNDVVMDQKMYTSADGQPCCPVVQLSKEELTDQVQLLTTGLLGKGGSALVFQALWPSRFGAQGLLAVKVLAEGDKARLACAQSFSYEAAVLACVRHPNVVRMYGYCLEPPCVCIILELLPCSLKQLLGRLTQPDSTSAELPAATTTSATPHGDTSSNSSSTSHKKLTVLEVVRLSSEVAAGLAYLHDGHKHTGALPASLSRHLQSAEEGGRVTSRVVHRDLKPANTLINSQGTAKISDFGLAREHLNSTVIMATGETVGVGTLPYMAPELLASKLLPTNKVDVYSLGLMMWEMLAHQTPWSGLQPAAIICAVIAGKRPFLPTTFPELQCAWEAAQQPASLQALPQLNAIIRQCWREREHKRPGAQQLYEMLVQLLQELQGRPKEQAAST